MTIHEAKTYGKEHLPDSPTPDLDAEVLLQFVTGMDKTHLLLNRNTELTAEQEAEFCAALAKRKTGFPIAYITGAKEFFGYDFYVTPAVLIPKPDTELLVEQAIAAVREKQAAHPQQILTVCDMCAGSGCVGLSILRAMADTALADGGRVPTGDGLRHAARDGHTDGQLGNGTARTLPALTLVDISKDALAVARTNAARLFSEASASKNQIHFVRSNLFGEVPHTFDVIVTNPPYVPHPQAAALLQDGRSEPLLALDGDVTENGDWSGTEDGLALIKRLVPQAYEHLAPGGVLLMETGEYNAEATAELFARAGLRTVRIERDLSGQLRVVIGRK